MLRFDLQILKIGMIQSGLETMGPGFWVYFHDTFPLNTSEPVL